MTTGEYMQAQADYVNHTRYLKIDIADSADEHGKAMSKAFFAVVAYAETLRKRVAELEAAAEEGE